VWIDEMVMISPLSLRTSATREIVITEFECADDLIRGKWTLESDLPSPDPIEISAKVYEIPDIYPNFVILRYEGSML
jgi:hypothetical protein